MILDPIDETPSDRPAGCIWRILFLTLASLTALCFALAAWASITGR